MAENPEEIRVNSNIERIFVDDELHCGTVDGEICTFNYTANNRLEMHNSFISHTMEFDPLESKQINPHINNISAIIDGGISKLFLSSNESTIKIHKVNNIDSKCIYTNKQHGYFITGLCYISDCRFISTDYLKIYSNDFERSKLLLDLKPSSIENLKFVITSMSVLDTNNFVYATSLGDIFLYDLRSREQVKLFDSPVPVTDFFTSIHYMKKYENCLNYRDINSFNSLDLRNHENIRKVMLIPPKDYKNSLIKTALISERWTFDNIGETIYIGSVDNRLIKIENTQTEVIAETGNFVKNVFVFNGKLGYTLDNGLYYYSNQ